MSESKTHYRKAFDSPYLSSADIVEPICLTVQCVTLEIDRTKKTKDMFNTAHFVEKEIRFPGNKKRSITSDFYSSSEEVRNGFFGGVEIIERALWSEREA